MSALHREHPDASDSEIDALQRAALLGIGRYAGTQPPPADPQITRECRDCGREFSLPADRADAPGKWYRLCAYCLAYEL